jgi:hypothetical protein
MRRTLLVLILGILLVQVISAEIIISQQPKEVYSLGDLISIPTTIKSTTDITGVFNMDLICSGHTVNFYKNGLSLSSGEEKKMDPSLVLTRNVIGELKGNCKIKAILGEDYVLTNEFRLSDLIDIRTNFEEVEFNPGDYLFIEGDAIKESGGDVNGFIELEMFSPNMSGNDTLLSQLETINNGFFSVNVTLPSDLKAGNYLLKLKAREVDLEGVTTNEGFRDQNVLVKQVPTSLEIMFEDREIEPGTSLRVKAILHDQTGENIESLAYLTIKNDNDKIREQMELATDEFLEMEIVYNEPPATWKVVASSNDLTNEAEFEILEKEDISIEIINKTVIITNKGNVEYNKTLLVKIGEDSENIDVFLDVDDSQKYVLTAPDGEYNVEVIAEGKSETAEIALTGKAVDVKKASSKAGSLIKYPVVWVFVILILGFIAFIVFKKGYKKSFIGYVGKKARQKKDEETSKELVPLKKDSLLKTRSKAVLSLSMKGDKQNVSIVSLKIKNLREIQSKKGHAEETLQKIVQLAEESKSAVYETQDHIFFILAPTRTKTFRNEKTALNMAQKIKGILLGHNKMFKQKFNFGIGLNDGTIVAKQEGDVLKFMSLGTLMAISKKISSLADNDILLGEKINEKLRTLAKTIKHEKGNLSVYSIKQVKNVEENQKFVKSFLKRMEK